MWLSHRITGLHLVCAEVNHSQYGFWGHSHKWIVNSFCRRIGSGVADFYVRHIARVYGSETIRQLVLTLNGRMIGYYADKKVISIGQMYRGNKSKTNPMNLQAFPRKFTNWAHALCPPTVGFRPNAGVYAPSSLSATLLSPSLSRASWAAIWLASFLL
jgi:hypothetical protein